jgi:oligoribonuclease (3'-5' exoribonuclease)
MTGLDYDNDEVIQIACFITDADLNLLDQDGFETVVHQSNERMSAMDEWCQKTHARSGLTAAVIASEITPEIAAEQLLAYVKKFVPDRRKALLAGNTVHADRAFLRRKPYDLVVAHLHHRIMDVSTIKEAVRRWSSDEVLKRTPQKRGLHEAKADILESIEEARYYRDVLFKPREETQ